MSDCVAQIADDARIHAINMDLYTSLRSLAATSSVILISTCLLCMCID